MNNIEFTGISLGFSDATVPPMLLFIIGLLIIVAMVVFQIKKKNKKTSTIIYSDLKIMKRAGRTQKQKLRGILPILRMIAVAFLFVAFARPRSGTEHREITSEGIDIMMLLDVSSSMQAEDFKPNNRLFVAKEEIKNFISKRMNDRIGLVVFARNAFTQCPLTTDYGVLLGFVDQVNFNQIADGTAIGMALATATNRLRESDAESKIIVLLTDGDNNAGEIDPITAANLASAFDIKIYTIGVGKSGNAMFPYKDPIFGKRYVYQPTKIDEKSLKEIADRTGGAYYRAKSENDLSKIYEIIDALEKTEVKISEHIEYKELFQQFSFAGIFFLLLEILLSYTYLRKLP